MAAEKVAKSIAKIKEMESVYGPYTPLLVHTDLTVVDKQLRIIHPSFWKYAHIKPSKMQSLNKLLMQNSITGCTTLINRKLLELAMPIPQQAVIMHDWWLGLVASALGHIGIIDEQTMLYRQHESNDTGAKKYSLSSLIQRLSSPQKRKKMSENIIKRQTQASTLYERYGTTLNSSQKQVLKAFIRYSQASFFEKRYLMFKYGLFKQGFLRNTFELLPLEWIFRK